MGAGENPEHYTDVAAWLHREADLLYTQRRLAESEAKVRQLLGLQEQVVGVDHPDYALGLCMLGELRFLSDDLGGAEILFRQALEIRRESLGERHPDFATSLGCLGGLLGRSGRLDEAERLLGQALRIRLEVLGEHHPDTALNRRELARLLRQRGEWSEARELSRARPASSARPENPEAGEAVALSEALARLGDEASSAAGRMISQGAPAPALLVEKLAECRREFLGLRERAQRRAESSPLGPPLEGPIETLLDVASLIDEVGETEAREPDCEEVRRRALGILDRVLALAHGRIPDFPPLRECQGRARQLREAIAGSPWTALPAQTEGLASGDHTFAHLVALVDDPESLSDEDWALAHESVRDGISGPLATAASRAQLVSGVAPPRALKDDIGDADLRGKPSVGNPWSSAGSVTNGASLRVDRLELSDSATSPSPSPVVALPKSTASLPLAAPHPMVPPRDPHAALASDLALASLVSEPNAHGLGDSPSGGQRPRVNGKGSCPIVIVEAVDPPPAPLSSQGPGIMRGPLVLHRPPGRSADGTGKGDPSPDAGSPGRSGEASAALGSATAQAGGGDPRKVIRVAVRKD